ncbi:MAG TPA: urease accessory protein UreD, partial [Mycobacterium sp.]|nr:urease accessory protein UreD [Mycobacterium sp.]
MVQRPFYPEGAACHVYVLHPPGGVVGGDRLVLDVDVASGAHAVITTPASAKFYRSAGPLATQQQRLHVAQHGILEWLPQETIFFAGCQVDTSTHVNMAVGARFIGAEVVCLGRPASGERFEAGRCRQRLEIWREEQPLIIERAALEGGHPILTERWGLAGSTVMGALIATPVGKAELQAVRSTVQTPDSLFSATLLGDVLLCRYLGHRAEQARRVFT